ncbi:hypothetical protein ABT282_08350 [Streptomyces sp. NPDC000927]|uniref:hypothetical protein n=1 Tax=Streptomyces sp. NPDC000927 TaxID=3154371 RepID=UPI00332482AB
MFITIMPILSLSGFQPPRLPRLRWPSLSLLVRTGALMSKKLARPSRPAIRLGDINPHNLVRELRRLHELGEDPAIERFPDDDEIFLVLAHAQRWSSSLKQPRNATVTVVAEVALIRVMLWQYLREQADIGQLRAIDDGRSAGVPWDQLAGPLCVTSKQGAYQKARRLQAEQVREPGERRTPEVARDHEKRARAEERAERAQIRFQERRFPAAHRVARLLLEHRDGLALDEWAEYWLDEVEESLDDRDDPEKQARFCGWVESCVRAIRAHEVGQGVPAARTDEAARALAEAREFVQG